MTEKKKKDARMEMPEAVAGYKIRIVSVLDVLLVSGQAKKACPKRNIEARMEKLEAEW